MTKAAGTGGAATDTKLRRLLTEELDLAFAVLAAVDLGIPDLLANGPRAVGDLAEHIGAHPLSLHRLMRALASRNVVREEVDERFSLTGLGAPLAGNAPDSLRREALWRASEGYLRTWGSLAQTVRSGEPGFEHVFGEPFFDYLGHNAQLAEVFNDVMTESSEKTISNTEICTSTISKPWAATLRSVSIAPSRLP